MRAVVYAYFLTKLSLPYTYSGIYMHDKCSGETKCSVTSVATAAHCPSAVIKTKEEVCFQLE